MLWPFAVKAAISRLNAIQIDINKKTPNNKFYGVDDSLTNVNDYHTFRCPVFVLDDYKAAQLGHQNGNHGCNAEFT